MGSVTYYRTLEQTGTHCSINCTQNKNQQNRSLPQFWYRSSSAKKHKKLERVEQIKTNNGIFSKRGKSDLKSIWVIHSEIRAGNSLSGWARGKQRS